MERLGDLVRLTRNPKLHELDEIEGAVRRFGFLERVIVNDVTGRLIAGHGRLDTLTRMREEGKELPANIEDAGDDWLVPTDHVSIPEDQEEAAALALNKIGEGTYDEALLLEVLKDIAEGEHGLESVGFQDWELVALGVKETDQVDNPNELWDGMPEFEQEKLSYQVIKVHFANAEDRESFSELIGQKLNEKTRSIWHPEQEQVSLGEIVEESES